MASVSGVQQLQVGCSGGVGTDMVENADKDGISLPVYFLKLDGYQIDLAEYSCREEVWSRVGTVQNLPLVILYDRFQLENVAYQ